LQALFAQRGVDASWEIVVIDDGSTDDTPDVVRELAGHSPVPLRYARQANRGPAAARNRGIRMAGGRLVYMTDSDVLATPDLIHLHLAEHDRHPAPSIGVLGLMRWAPDLPVTPFMRWWEEARFRFNRLLEDVEPINHTYFYTCNVSVKRAFLMEHGLFDESFPSAAYEDTELAYRLRAHGFRLVFAPDALAYHDHSTDFAHACRQMETIGRSAPLYRARTGHSGVPRWWNWVGQTPLASESMAALLRPLVERLQDHTVVPALFVPVLMHHFRRGQREYKRSLIQGE
jgi:GT2 family glycosyltransferase